MSSDSVEKIRSCMKQLRGEKYNDPSFYKDCRAAGDHIEKLIRSMDNIRSVLCFYPLDGEISLLELYKRLLSDYKLYFPVSREMDLFFYRVSDVSDTSFLEGSMNVPEPVNRDCKYMAHQAKESCAIVPGLAFSPVSMGRIGYGKGYYDRFLAENEGIFTIGACFEFQLNEALPQEKWDIPVKKIVTEQNIYG